MRIARTCSSRAVGLLSGSLLLIFAVTGLAAEQASYNTVVDGVAVYFGIVPSQLVRGLPSGPTEKEMHGGVPEGESHIMVALFDDKSGKRITDAQVSAHVTGDRGLDLRKPLESFVVANATTYGNYFKLLGAGPYRIQVTIHRPGAARDVNATFTWKRQ